MGSLRRAGAVSWCRCGRGFSRGVPTSSYKRMVLECRPVVCSCWLVVPHLSFLQPCPLSCAFQTVACGGRHGWASSLCLMDLTQHFRFPPLSQLLKIAQLARRSCHQREKSLPGDFARVAAAVRGLQVIGLPFHVEAPRRGSCAGGCLPQTSAYQEQCWVGQESNGAGMHGRLS